MLNISIPYGSEERILRGSGEESSGGRFPKPGRRRALIPSVRCCRALENPIGAPPLRDAARGMQRVVIAADDLTRQTPVEIIIPALLDELNPAGVRDEQVTVLIALGTHRP